MNYTIGPYKPLSDIKADLIIDLTHDFRNAEEAVQDALILLRCSQGLSDIVAFKLLQEWIEEAIDAGT